MALDLLLDVDFVNRQAVADGVRVAGLTVEEVRLEVEGVGQAVRRVHAHHQRAIAQARKLEAGGGRQAGFSHASLAAEQKDAHSFIVDGNAFPLDNGQRPWRGLSSLMSR